MASVDAEVCHQYSTNHKQIMMSNSTNDKCEVAVGGTQACGVARREHQSIDVNTYISQESDIDLSASHHFHSRQNTPQSFNMARGVANHFNITSNSTAPFNMTHITSSFDAQRGTAQFEMARSNLQHPCDFSQSVGQSTESHRREDTPYDMPRGPVGYDMARGNPQYEMPRTQPYEVTPTPLQQVLRQDRVHLQETDLAKKFPQSIPDAQQGMEMPLEMPQTAPQSSVRTRPGQKPTGHPFDFAKGYAQRLELAKNAAQKAIQTKIKALKMREATKLTGETKQEVEADKSNCNTQSSEILKLYAQQLQMLKKAAKPSEVVKTARLKGGATTGGLTAGKQNNMQHSYCERLEKRKASVLNQEDIREEEKRDEDNTTECVADDNGRVIRNKEDSPPLEMAEYLAQLSQTDCARNHTWDGQDNSVAEKTVNTSVSAENMSQCSLEAANLSDLPLSSETINQPGLPLGAGMLVGRGLKHAKRDRQELTIANKAKLIEQVECRGVKKKADIAREWGVRPSTLSTIMKNKDKILMQFKTQRYAAGRRRMRTAAYPDVEEGLLTWFRYARAGGIPITGPVLQGMGVTLAQELGHPEFSCSVGWLDRFKARHGLSFNPKNSQDTGTVGTFNESQERVASPLVSSDEVTLDTDISHSLLFPPSMPAVAPTVTSGQIENLSPSWLSNAMTCLSSTVEESEEHLHKWFPENISKIEDISVEEYDDSEATEDLTSTWFRNTVPALLKEKQARDIFSASETALFYNLLPDKMVAGKGEDGHKWAWIQDRVTVLVAVNMDGSEKLPLLVVGQKHSAKANSLVDEEAAALPLSFETNDTAMMTSSLFESWLHQLNKQYQNSNRTISIIVDNSLVHSRPKTLGNVQLVFLPANAASRLQPLEQGVIHTLKSLYRQSVLERMVDTLEAGQTYEVTLLEAMEILQQSWKQVKRELIVKSFHKAGLLAAEDLTDGSEADGEDTVCLLERARCLGLDIPKEVTFQSYLKIDSEVQTTVEQEGELELRVGDEGVVDPTSPNEALHGLAVFKKFCVEQRGPGTFLDIVMDLEKWVAEHIVKTEIVTTE